MRNYLRYVTRRWIARAISILWGVSLWYYYPEALNEAIKVSTRVVGWSVRVAAYYAPEPYNEYGKTLLDWGDVTKWIIDRSLSFVPPAHRARVEVLVRLRYEPGAWLVVFFFGSAVVMVWVVTRDRAKKRTPEEETPTPR
jgi:hypothetical protein